MADTAYNIEIFLETLRSLLPSLRQQNNERLTRRIGKEKLEDAADDLAGFIEAGTDRELTKNERLALSSRVMECLAAHIAKELALPVTLNTVVQSMQLIQHACDQSFPGYSGAGLLRYTIMPVRSVA